MILNFADLEDGNLHTGTVLLDSYRAATKKDGGEYVSLVLGDGEQRKMSFSYFDGVFRKMKEEGFQDGSAISATLQKKNNYYNVVSMRNGNEETPEALEALAQRAPINVKAGFDEILASVQMAVVPEKDYSYAKVTEYLLLKYKEKILRSSAAIAKHHDYMGGLVHHTLGMVRMARNMNRMYPNINKELLVCGAALHDIAKIVEYITTDYGTAQYSIDGILSGHIYLGAEMIRDAYLELGIDKEFEMRCLMHMIQSHHGEYEYGAIKIPAFPEAYLLHAIDMIDSRMQMFEKDLKDLEPGAFVKGNTYGAYVLRLE